VSGSETPIAEGESGGLPWIPLAVVAALVVIGAVVGIFVLGGGSDAPDTATGPADTERTTMAPQTSTSTTERSTTTRDRTTTEATVADTVVDTTTVDTAPPSTEAPPVLAATGGVSLGVSVPRVTGVGSPPGPSGAPLPVYQGWLGKLKPHQDDGRSDGGPPPPAGAPGTAPLTGLASSHPRRPAIVAKIDNSSSARPQAGLNTADIVYEERVEGSATRLAAVFHSQSPGVIGPIRSARTTDIGIVGSYREPIFSWSGSNEVFAGLIRKQPIVDRGAEIFGGYGRSAQRRAPYNLFTDTSVLWASAGGREPAPHFAYRPLGTPVTSPASPVSTIRLSFGGGVNYSWDASLAGWARTQGGAAHNDSNGLRIAPENVVVQFVDYGDTGLRDVAGSVVPEATMLGSGSALIFTDGQVITGTWTKSTLFQPTRFNDSNGKLVELTPGITWVELIEPGLASYG
jgi:hypothetical protein